MQREVCLKHRNNRREIILRVRTQIRVGSGVCSFLSKTERRGCARNAASAARICGHRSRVGLLSANQGMPVQFRLAAPIFRNPQSKHTMCAACASLRSRVSKTQRARGSTGTPCHFSKRGGARWEGSGLISRLRAGSIPAPATNFMGCSIIQEVTRLASGRARCKAVAVHFFQIAGRLRTREVS